MSLNEENGASSTVFDAGLELIKADFHLHTQKDKEFSYTGEQNDFVKSYIDALKQANIGVGVLTNHNKFDKDEYKAIKKRANREGIFILPGVELTVKEGANGVHTLIVFNPDEWLENGNNYIQTFLTTAFATVSNPENRNTKCTYDLKNALEKLEEYGRDCYEHDHIKKAVSWALREIGKTDFEYAEKVLLTAYDLLASGNKVQIWIAKDVIKELETVVKVKERKRLITSNSKMGRER